MATSKKKKSALILQKSWQLQNFFPWIMMIFLEIFQPVPFQHVAWDFSVEQKCDHNNWRIYLSSTMLTNMCFQSKYAEYLSSLWMSFKGQRLCVMSRLFSPLFHTKLAGCSIRLHRSNSCVMPCTATSLLNFSMQLKWWAFQNRFSINWH
jgi:hypothetical protein